MVVLLGISVVVSNGILSAGFLRIEAEAVDAEVERLRQFIFAERENIERLTADWAPWDESFRFVRGENPGFVAENLTHASMFNLALDVLIFLDATNHIVFGAMLDPATSDFREPSVDLAIQLEQLAPLMHQLPALRPRSGIVLMNEGPTLVAVHRIMPSDRAGKPAGTLIFGRHLSGVLTQRMTRLLGRPVSFHVLDKPGQDPQVRAAIAALTHSSETRVAPVSEDVVSGFTLLNDLAGRPLLLARIDLERNIHREFHVSENYLVSSLACALVVIGFVIVYVLRNIFLDRVAAMVAAVNGIRSRTDLSARLHEKGADELAGLAAAINQMLASLEQTEALQRKTSAALASESGRLEEERQRANKLESIGLLAGGIAHDFNNVLTSVLSNTSLAMISVPDDSETRASLQEVEKACLRAKTLTQQLLTFAKGGAPVKKLADIGVLCRETGGFAVRGSTVRCHFDIAADLWPAEVDEGQIVQVIQNLVINAVQAMPAGGNIHLVARNVPPSEPAGPLPRGRYVSITVADEGEGIPRESLPRIFDPYFTTKAKGSGLGLATAYSIVRRHGGHIAVRSDVGRGSTFRVFLPASSGETVAAPAASGRPWRGRGRLLLMDDEEAPLRATKTLLVRLGFEVVTTLDGDQAIAEFERARAEGHPFVAVIMDLTVPGGMGGREAAQRMKQIDPDAKLIVSSGYSNDSVMADHVAHGFCAVLAKPYTMTELIAVMRPLIDGDALPALPSDTQTG